MDDVSTKIDQGGASIQLLRGREIEVEHCERARIKPPPVDQALATSLRNFTSEPPMTSQEKDNQTPEDRARLLGQKLTWQVLQLPGPRSDFDKEYQEKLHKLVQTSATEIEKTLEGSSANASSIK